MRSQHILRLCGFFRIFALFLFFVILLDDLQIPVPRQSSPAGCHTAVSPHISRPQTG